MFFIGREIPPNEKNLCLRQIKRNFRIMLCNDSFCVVAGMIKCPEGCIILPDRHLPIRQNKNMSSVLSEPVVNI